VKKCQYVAAMMKNIFARKSAKPQKEINALKPQRRGDEESKISKRLLY
jgi:hypothetical protein